MSRVEREKQIARMQKLYFDILIRNLGLDHWSRLMEQLAPEKPGDRQGQSRKPE